MRALNILVLVGSPRNEESWTYKSIRILEAKMQALQPVAFEYIFTLSMYIRFFSAHLNTHSCIDNPLYSGIANPLTDKEKINPKIVITVTCHVQ